MTARDRKRAADGRYDNERKANSSPSGSLVACDLGADDTSRYIPRDGALGDYYASTDAKHFGGTIGSQFTEQGVRSLDDVARLAIEQRGGLDGDDWEDLETLGASPEARNPNFRYLLVRTRGTLGAVQSDELPADTLVHVMPTKVGAPCSLVADMDEGPQVDHAVIIMGNPDPSTYDHDIVITAHPGTPGRAGSGQDIFAPLEGQSISVAQARQIAGGEVTVNIRRTP